jgi:hypothetical protein
MLEKGETNMFREIRFYDDYTTAVASPWWIAGTGVEAVEEVGRLSLTSSRNEPKAQ